MEKELEEGDGGTREEDRARSGNGKARPVCRPPMSMLLLESVESGEGANGERLALDKAGEPMDGIGGADEAGRGAPAA